MYFILFTALKAVQLLVWFCICKTLPLMYKANEPYISLLSYRGADPLRLRELTSAFSLEFLDMNGKVV